VTRFEDTLRERDPISKVWAQQFHPDAFGMTRAERDAIVDALAAGRDLQSWLDNAGLWQPDDPEFLATSRNHRVALARLDAGVSE
jgi:hypothetical protein